MTDYINPDKLYPDDISRCIDNPPGNDSIRGNSDQDELSAYRATGLTPEAVQEMVSFPYTADEEDETKMMANQCVVCGHEMPEGDQVCKACRAQAETRTVAWAAENISGRIAQLEAEVGILKRLLETMQHE
jgi:hypothetical protein